MLFGLWMLGAGTLLAQERPSLGRVRRELRARRERRTKYTAPDFGAAMRAYLKRDFHPSHDAACDELARAYVAEAGLDS
jgi:hypothetical protein